MAKPTIVTRLGKGSELTFQEGDDNFTNLRDATISIKAGTGGTSVSSDLNGELTLVAGTGISLSGNNTAKTITVAATTPTAVTVLSDDTTNATYYPLVSAATFGNAQPRTDSGFTYNPSTGVLTATTFSGAMSYTTLTDKPTIPTNNNELTNGAGYITGINSSAVTTALGFTPESSANKNANNGYAGLDSAGKVASAQLPSYVDDVVEAANYEALPATGETGKIYVTLDINKTFRWSGSAYVEIAASPGTTDNVPEGTTNQYFTTTRARGAFSASTGISITDGAIATTITQYTDAGARAAISVTDAGGDGSLSYANSTGVITYTGPSNTDYRAAFSAGTGITITDGVVATTITQGITDVVNDTTPQLGGSLDVNGQSIVSVSNGNIVLAPNGTGQTVIKNIEYNEFIHSLGTTSGTIAPDVANGNVQTITLNGNLTLNAFTNPIAGQSLTLIITTGGTGRTLTSTMKFSGASKTLSTTSTTDIISVFYDGTNYWASLGKGFA
jgi:hypothetical protein